MDKIKADLMLVGDDIGDKWMRIFMANKFHKCCICKKPIKTGEIYVVEINEEFKTMKYHQSCNIAFTKWISKQYENSHKIEKQLRKTPKRF